MGSAVSSQTSVTRRQQKSTKPASRTTTTTSRTPVFSSRTPLTQSSTTASPRHIESTETVPHSNDRNMEQVVIRASRARVNAVDLHSVCGYTTQGVPAFSNGTSNTWTNSKSYLDGVFMGYRWQCVEFARRWLWTTQRLLLPERNCAYCFANCKHVYRLKDDPQDLRRQQQPAGQRGSRGATAAAAADLSSLVVVETNAASPTEEPAEVLGPCKNADAWEKVPAVFVKQGSLVPPVSNSLIVYPMSWGSPWGHIGVITKVDLVRGLVYVADQNRYFHHWGHRAYSAVFPLEVERGRYYIRDPESECKGWLTFPSSVEGH